MKTKLNKWAIFWGAMVGLLLIAIYLCVLRYAITIDNYYTDWILYDIVISLTIYMISGFVTGIIAGYRANLHALWVAIIVVVVYSSAVELSGYGGITLISLVMKIIGCAILTILGSSIGMVCRRRKTVCPLCLKPTVLKTALKGKNKGKQYYICINYPECKGRIKA